MANRSVVVESKCIPPPVGFLPSLGLYRCARIFPLLRSFFLGNMKPHAQYSISTLSPDPASTSTHLTHSAIISNYITSPHSASNAAFIPLIRLCTTFAAMCPDSFLFPLFLCFWWYLRYCLGTFLPPARFALIAWTEWRGGRSNILGRRGFVSARNWGFGEAEENERL